MMPQTLDLMERRAKNCKQTRNPDGTRDHCMSCKHVLALVAEVRRLTKPYVIDMQLGTAPSGSIGTSTWRMVET